MIRYLKAFKLLSGRRQIGMSANPILVSEMVVVATSVYIFDDLEDFVLIMSDMDDGYLAANSKKAASKAEKKA